MSLLLQKHVGGRKGLGSKEDKERILEGEMETRVELYINPQNKTHIFPAL